MKFVQIHELISYPASNLNRDDIQRPKTVKIGDSTRLRISSQSLKRAWRVSDVMSEAFPDMGIRTKVLSKYIQDALESGISLQDMIAGNNKVTREKVDKKTAKAYGELLDNCIRDPKSSSGDESKENDKDKGEKKKQLIHYSPIELSRIDEIMAKVAKGETPEIPKLISDDNFPVDIAMFGRMVAGDRRYDCEAAVQVAHAFTVHKAVI